LIVKNLPSKVALKTSLRWLGPNFCSIFFYEAVHVKIFFFKFCKNWNLKFKEKSEQLGWMNRKMKKQNLMKISQKISPFTKTKTLLFKMLVFLTIKETILFLLIMY
jgi:hypothetical protein